jgi:predicted nucleic acid-binding protein
MFLIDTNCLSELTRVRPDQNVVNWFTSHDESTMYLSVITMGELIKGISKLPDSAKKVNLALWINNDLESRFRHRILSVDERVATEWGRLQAQMESEGCPIPAVDALIASTCIVHNLILVTRNIKDFERTGLNLINPWDCEQKKI